MDTRDEFDKKCLRLFFRIHVLVQAFQAALARGATEQELHELLVMRADTVQEALDYTLEHWEYMDPETQEGWKEVAAQLVLVREQEKDGQDSETADED